MHRASDLSLRSLLCSALISSGLGLSGCADRAEWSEPPSSVDSTSGEAGEQAFQQEGPAGAGGAGGNAPGDGGGRPAGGSSPAAGAPGGGTGGGNVTSICAPDCTKRATASMGLVDDFEAETTAKLAGGWFTFTDGTGSTEPAPAEGVVPQLTLGPTSSTTLALRFGGVGHTAWGGGLGAWLDGCTDISAFTKLRFWAKGSGTFTFNAVTFETNSCREGGGCASDCRSNAKAFTLTDEWRSYQIPLAALTGGSASFSKLKVQSLTFAVSPPDSAPYDWELWIDDVTLE